MYELTKEEDNHLCSLLLFGKHCSKEGRGRKSGEAGSIVCFFWLVLSELVVGGSNVNVALGTKVMEDGTSSFFQALETRPTTSNPGKNVELGNFDWEAWLPFLHTSDVTLACTDAILIQNYSIHVLKDKC